MKPTIGTISEDGMMVWGSWQISPIGRILDQRRALSLWGQDEEGRTLDISGYIEYQNFIVDIINICNDGKIAIEFNLKSWFIFLGFENH